jgi:hypothetical protein
LSESFLLCGQILLKNDARERSNHPEKLFHHPAQLSPDKCRSQSGGPSDCRSQFVQCCRWAKPVAGETPYVATAVTSASGIAGIKPYYSAELTGNFTAVDILDDGQHHDGAANDGLYGASLPAQTAGTSVLFTSRRPPIIPKNL